jgi:membrane protein
MSLRHRFQRLADRVARSFPAEVARRFGANDVMSMAAALSFYTLISLAPLVTLLLWLTTTLYAAAQEEFFRQLGQLAGSQVEETVRTVVRNAEQDSDGGRLAAWLGFAALLLGASVVFSQLQLSLNRIFESPSVAGRGIVDWLRKRLLSLGMVVTLGFLLVVSMVAQAGLELVAARVPSAVPVVLSVLSLLVYTLIFAALYHWIPDRPVDTRRSLIGGAMTAVLFMVGRAAIGYYLGRAAMGSAYGPAGGLVVMLVWVYYSAMVFFVGAIATAVLDARARRAEHARQLEHCEMVIPAPTR